MHADGQWQRARWLLLPSLKSTRDYFVIPWWHADETSSHSSFSIFPFLLNLSFSDRCVLFAGCVLGSFWKPSTLWTAGWPEKHLFKQARDKQRQEAERKAEEEKRGRWPKGQTLINIFILMGNIQHFFFGLFRRLLLLGLSVTSATTTTVWSHSATAARKSLLIHKVTYMCGLTGALHGKIKQGEV